MSEFYLFIESKRGKDPLSEVHDVSESPEVEERALDQIITNQSEFEWTFCPEEYWDSYLRDTFEVTASTRARFFLIYIASAEEKRGQDLLCGIR